VGKVQIVGISNPWDKGQGARFASLRSKEQLERGSAEKSDQVTTSAKNRTRGVAGGERKGGIFLPSRKNPVGDCI